MKNAVSKRIDVVALFLPEIKEMMNQIIRRAAEEHKAKNQATENKED